MKLSAEQTARAGYLLCGGGLQSQLYPLHYFPSFSELWKHWFHIWHRDLAAVHFTLTMNEFENVICNMVVKGLQILCLDKMIDMVQTTCADDTSHKSHNA